VNRTMVNVGRKIREVTGVRADTIPEDILTGREPVVLRCLVADWPFVKAGLAAREDAAAYLRRFYGGEIVAISRGGPEAKGRVFYNDDLSGPNFRMERGRLEGVLDDILAHAADAEPPLTYVGSTTVDTCLPGFRAENDLALGPRDPLVSVWIGGKSRIAAHYDLPDNVACVCVGRRRFTLFPPEALKDLYVGPLDMTPAGQAVSLVDFENPDYERFPRFKDALAAAQVADLAPGDALFIPGMWWHHVEALEGFNVLVNYWWRKAPAHMGPPINALLHALMAVRDLPGEEKRIWRDIFNHYVFENDEETAAHIPEGRHGILGDMDEENARRIRAFLLNRLNR